MLMVVGEELSNIGENSPTIKSYSDLETKLEEEDGAWVGTIVVDDFFSESEEGNRTRLVNELKSSGCSQIVSVTKADANVMAVSCASVISTYLQNLHLKELAKAIDRNLDYKDIFTGTISEDIYEKVKEA